MANRRITVLNPAGYQEIFQSGDNLLLDGDVNLQSNGLTGVTTPAAATDAANKDYVDTGDILNAAEIQNNANDITSIDARVTTIENTLPSGANNATVSFTGSEGITFPNNSSFTLDQSADITIEIAGPSLANYLQKPGTNGDFIITETGGSITYSDVIDCGSY